MRRILFTLFALVLIPQAAQAQFGAPFASADDDGLTFGVQMFGGSTFGSCEDDCGVYSAGLYVQRANGQSLGVDATWWDMSDITISYGWPVGALTTYLGVSFGRYATETVGANDYTSMTESNRFVMTGIGAGFGAGPVRARVSHDGNDATLQMGFAFEPARLFE